MWHDHVKCLVPEICCVLFKISIMVMLVVLVVLVVLLFFFRCDSVSVCTRIAENHWVKREASKCVWPFFQQIIRIESGATIPKFATFYVTQTPSFYPKPCKTFHIRDFTKSLQIYMLRLKMRLTSKIGWEPMIWIDERTRARAKQSDRVWF